MSVMNASWQTDSSDARVGQLYSNFLEGNAGGFDDNAVVISYVLPDAAVGTANRVVMNNANVSRFVGLQKAVVSATAWPLSDAAGTANLGNRVLMLLTKSVNRAPYRIANAVKYVASGTTWTDLGAGTGITTLNSLGATGDALYIGSPTQFSHVFAAIHNTNSNAVTISGEAASLMSSGPGQNQTMCAIGK